MGEYIQRLIDWIVDVVKSAFLSIVDFFKDFFYWCLDMILQLVSVLIDLAFSGLTLIDITQYLNMLPEETLQVMGALGLGEAFGIIITAVIIRLLLQVIPFTRLGS